MIAVAFTEDNDVIHPPPDCPPELIPILSVFRGKNHRGVPVVVSCWKMTREERELFLETGTIWLTTMGDTMPPALLTVESPFIQVENANSSKAADSN